MISEFFQLAWAVLVGGWLVLMFMLWLALIRGALEEHDFWRYAKRSAFVCLSAAMLIGLSPTLFPAA